VTGAVARDVGFRGWPRPCTQRCVHGAVHIDAAPGEASYRGTGKRVVLTAPPGHPLTIGRPL
jgi:hypothetical protein